MTVLDPGEGAVAGGQIVWSDYVPPEASRMFTYTFGLSETPGVTITLPAASLALVSPSNEILSDSVAAAPFVLPWPVTVARVVPSWIAPGSAATAIITVTNETTATLTGALTFSLLASSNAAVYWDTQAWTLLGQQSQPLTYTLPVTLTTVGDYQAIGRLQTGGASGIVFSDPVSIGATPPLVVTGASPTAPDGIVKPGSSLTYTVRLTNTASIPLTGIVVSNTIPGDLAVTPGSISDGGSQMGAYVQWTITELAAGASRGLTFSVVIPQGYVAAGQGRYLQSQAILRSNESPATTGQAATVLVFDPLKQVFLPLIRR